MRKWRQKVYILLLLRVFRKRKQRNEVVLRGEDLRRVFVQTGYYSKLTDDEMVTRGNTDERESGKIAGAKYLKPARSNRIHVQVKALALDKSKDS